MPIRQNILRKGKAPKQNLLSFDVLQEESGVLGDLTTSRFFKISEFPPVLPSGNSSFLIEGSNLLKPEIELKTELLDAQGNPIFHYAIPNYDKELPARRIAVEVYDDEVVNGVGSFTILGELNPREFDISSEFQDTYNVRFTAPVSINREIKNTQPIRFYGDPTLSVSELVKGVIEKAPTGGSSNISITGSVEFINPNAQAQFSVNSGSTTGNSNQFAEVGNSAASYINKSQYLSQSSPLPKAKKAKKQFSFVVKEMEKGVDNALNKITSAMKGASFSITRPDLLVDSHHYPDSIFDKPQSFETKILDVINSSTFTTTTDYTITHKKSNNKLIVPFGASSSNATITHEVVSSTETEDQVFKRSFANMVVGNLRTFSGDTYKAKIYMKEDGTSGEFEPIYETLVESPNELVNPNSISGFQNIGLFFTQSIIDNNWTTSSAQAPATQNDDTIIDGVLLSGSNAELGSSFTFLTKNTLSLEKNEDYIVEFNAAYSTAPKAQSDGTTKTLAELEVFITGSFETENQSEISLGRVETTRGSLGGRFLPLKRQITDFKTHNGNSSPSGSLGFRVNSGQFKLSDIRLRPFSQTNFSPGFFKANVPMPKPIKRGKLYDFMVEFYDANNNLAEAIAIVDNISFQGPPQVIADGADGLLTGSLFISNVTGSGIELHGGSAYMRSVGYNGFNDTISNNVGGFLMFSGSVSESMGTTEDYEGVGLEIVDAHGDTDRFLKFRTNPSEFTVQTDQFFLGKAGQFISGSNGNIVISSSNFFLGGENTFVSGSNDKLEISSSNFHLDDDGSVTMQGTITAEAGGTIGGFTIGSSSLAAGNIFQLSSSQNIEDPASMISSSKFKVSAGGQVSASDMLLTGGTITSDVTVEGTFSANSILTPANIAGVGTTPENASASIDARGNANFRSGSIGGFRMDATTLFSDSAEFVVTGSTGQITGSQVLFTGGVIGGFELGPSIISSSNDNLILKSSGQITASSADLTGDLNATHIKADSGSIGGFDLSSTTFNSTDGNISLNSSQKAFRISNATFGNTGIQLEHNSGTPRAHIGKSDGEGFKFDGTNVIMSSSAFLLGSRAGGNSFVSGSNGGIEISGSAFHLLNGTITASNVDLSGKITADSGEIGGFAITENAISSSNNELILRGDGTGTSAGQITGSRVLFSGGEIGGFLITSDTIETKDFVSGLKGVRISTSNNGSLEVEEARIRGTLKTTVFEKETVNAVGGQLIVANSTAITGSDVGKTDVTMSVENVTGFAADEILLIKKVSGSNFSTEYVQVISSSNDFNSDTNFQGKLMVSRSFGSSATYNPALHSGSITTTTATGSTYTTGQVLVSTGKIDTGFIKLNANPNDSATPFIDIVERTGSGVFDVDLKARLGDLSGLSSGLVGSSPGFGLFSENVFLTGKITATSGEIGGLTIGSDKVHVGTGTHGNSNTAFYVDDSGKFSLKDKLVWDGTDLNIDGTLSIGSLPAGTVSGSAQLAADISGAADTSEISASAAAGQSGSLAFDTHATQVVIASSGMSLKNSSAQDIAVFGASAKLLGGANNTADFAEVNGDGLTIVANSETASIMNGGGTAIMGGTATASLNSSGLTLISGGQTGSLVSANGVAIYGASDKNERLDVNADGLTLIANNITGSLVNAAGVAIYGATDKKERLDVNAAGVTLIANNITGSSFTATTSSIFGSSDKHERVEIVGTGMNVYQNNAQVANFGATTTIGNTATEHIRISGSGFELKDGSTQFIGMDANGMSIGNNIILATNGNATFNGTVTIGGTDLTTGNTLNTNTTLGNVGLSLADISGSISGSYLNSASSSMASRVKIESTGISIDNASGTSLAALTNTLRVGVVGDNKSRLEIDTDGNLEIINRQGSTDTTVVSLDKDGNGTFSGDLSAAGGTFAGQLTIGGSDTSLTSAAIANALSAEISGSSLSGSNSATTTGEAAKSDAASAQSTADGAETNAQTGISNAATAQAAVDVVESRTIITSADVTVAHNSGHNKGIFNAAGLTIIGNNQTGSLFGNFGAEVYGASDKNERLTIGSNGVSLIANNITGSVITAAGTTIFGASDKKERLDVNADGVTLIANNVTGSFIDANGMEIYGASDKQEKAFINSDGMTVIAGNVTASRFGTDVVIGEVGASKSNVQITSGAINLRTNTTNKLTIAANGTMTIGNNISLTAGGDATFSGDLNAAGGTFSGNLVIGGSSTALTTTALAASLATEISGSSLSGSNSATATGEASVSASTSATATGEQGIADAATAQGAVDTIEEKVVIGGSSVSVQQNSSNKAVLTTSGVELFQGGTSVSNFGSSVRIGPDANSKSRVEISSGAVQIINKDGSGNETTMLNFKSDGDIESGDFLIERSRLFGAGGDGDIVLKSNDCTVSNGAGSAARSSNSVIVDERGDQVCVRTGAVWEMKGDWYTKSLEVDSSVAATTLITSGSRLFVQGALTIDSGCVIHNDGGDGDTGANAATSDNSTSGYGDGGANSPTKPGSGGPGNSLAAGGDGAPGSRGGNPDSSGGGTVYGANGGAGGGNGGIVMIAARTITNNGTIRSHGGDGGDGGRGSSASPGAGGTGAANGTAGSAGSVVHVKI